MLGRGTNINGALPPQSGNMMRMMVSGNNPTNMGQQQMPGAPIQRFAPGTQQQQILGPVVNNGGAQAINGQVPPQQQGQPTQQQQQQQGQMGQNQMNPQQPMLQQQGGINQNTNFAYTINNTLSYNDEEYNLNIEDIDLMAKSWA